MREDSIFCYYQKLIRIRKHYDIVVYGTYDLLLPEDPELYVYTRTLGEEQLLIVCNFYGNTRMFTLPDNWKLEKTEMLIGNYKDFKLGKELTIRPYETVVLRKTGEK